MILFKYSFSDLFGSVSRNHFKLYQEFFFAFTNFFSQRFSSYFNREISSMFLPQIFTVSPPRVPHGIPFTLKIHLNGFSKFPSVVLQGPSRLSSRIQGFLPEFLQGFLPELFSRFYPQVLSRFLLKILPVLFRGFSCNFSQSWHVFCQIFFYIFSFIMDHFIDFGDPPRNSLESNRLFHIKEKQE